jgi:predicted ester cyclase
MEALRQDERGENLEGDSDNPEVIVPRTRDQNLDNEDLSGIDKREKQEEGLEKNPVSSNSTGGSVIEKQEQLDKPLIKIAGRLYDLGIQHSGNPEMRIVLEELRTKLNKIESRDPADPKTQTLLDQITEKINKEEEKQQKREEDLSYLRGLEVKLNPDNEEPSSEIYTDELAEIRGKLSDLLLKYPDPADKEMQELNSQISGEINKREKQQKLQALEQEAQKQFEEIKLLISVKDDDRYYGGHESSDSDYYFRYITSRINEDITKLKRFGIGRIFNRQKIKELEALYNTLWNDQNGYIRNYYRLQQQIKELEEIK